MRARIGYLPGELRVDPAYTGDDVIGYYGLTDAVHPSRLVDPWHWYLGRNVLAAGPAVDAVVVPLVLSAVLAAAGLLGFSRRDLR